MTTIGDMLSRAVLIGVGATLFMDIWGVVQKRIFGMQTLDYALVGRWVAYLPRGRFRHDPIAASPPIRGEGTIGWITHYYRVRRRVTRDRRYGVEPLSDARSGARGRNRQRDRAVSDHAAGNGCGDRREPHAAPERGAPAQPCDARRVRDRALCGRVGHARRV